LEPNLKIDGENTKTANEWRQLNSLLMQLRKVCDHPYLLPSAEPADTIADDGSAGEDIVQASGKLAVLDRLLQKLKKGGHR
jgi:SWI/SNF-related matrix-associated actin-dependent regulator of chromatin subfamily A member 5